MNLYLISGKAGSGKTKVANILCRLLGNAVVTNFSKYIKLFALELGKWDGIDSDKPRAFLQNTGDLLREVNENLMTNRMYEDILVYEKLGINNVIVSDVRLVNELEYFKRKDINVITIRVNSNESRRNLNNSEKTHHTELELDNYNNFDYVIENDDDKLEEKVKEIVKGRLK